MRECGWGVPGISAQEDKEPERVPAIWRVMSLLGPDFLSEYESEFLGCRIERLFYFSWRNVVTLEYKMLGKRLENWYTEDLAAKPGSHKPVEQRRSQYPSLMSGEEAAFAAELTFIQRIWFKYCLMTMPLARGFLNETRDRYRFFGMGDEVWIGTEQKGRGNVPD